MVKGAIILGIGFSLGYAKAIHDQEELRMAFLSMSESFKEFVVDSKDNIQETPTQTEDSPIVSDAVEEPVIQTQPAHPDAGYQGE